MDSLPDVIRYNKALVTPGQVLPELTTAAPATTSIPLPGIIALTALRGVCLLVLKSRRQEDQVSKFFPLHLGIR